MPNLIESEMNNTYLAMNLSQNLLIGLPKEELQESKIKDNVDLAGLSQQLVLWRDYISLKLEN